jgi:hypothetical protein
MLPACAAPGPTWKAGAAAVCITPDQPMWMAGYASRDRPAEGKLSELWAKALAIEDPGGRRALVVTLDLIGLDRELSRSIRRALEDALGLERRGIALCSSHTHSGPVVAGNLRPMHVALLDEAQRRLVERYARTLEERILTAARRATERLSPARLRWGNGSTDFAVNRRNNKEADVPRLRAEGKLRGPSDPAVPVLEVRAPDGAVRALLFGYACHCTVLSSYAWCGDYAGFAQEALEAAHPGAVALFWAGCGGDQNPLPRRTVELARDYGRRLADAVRAAPLRPLTGTLRTRYAEIDLALATLPTRAELQKQSEEPNPYVAARARWILSETDAGRPPSPTYPYPVQVWDLGDEVQWILLGGEVVVDYALRLKRELRGERTWVAAYTNDVMAYIPSRRVLEEGGYEGGGAMVYYGLPTVWAPEVEETIVREVHRQAGDPGK